MKEQRLHAIKAFCRFIDKCDCEIIIRNDLQHEKTNLFIHYSYDNMRIKRST